MGLHAVTGTALLTCFFFTTGADSYDGGTKVLLKRREQKKHGLIHDWHHEMFGYFSVIFTRTETSTQYRLFQANLLGDYTVVKYVRKH
jgi:hypothetical protein